MSGAISGIAAVIQSIDRDRSHRFLLLPSSFNSRRTHFRITHTVIMPASLRNRLPSETRVAVCLMLGPVFVLWQEGKPEVASPPRPRRTIKESLSNGSTGSTRRGHANSGEPAWGFPSQAHRRIPRRDVPGGKPDGGRNKISDPHPRVNIDSLP
jgi:hypothetical protein